MIPGAIPNFWLTRIKLSFPEDPCMEYLPTLTPKVIQNNPNVGKYSIHGSLGIHSHSISWLWIWFGLHPSGFPLRNPSSFPENLGLSENLVPRHHFPYSTFGGEIPCFILFPHPHQTVADNLVSRANELELQADMAGEFFGSGIWVYKSFIVFPPAISHAWIWRLWYTSSILRTVKALRTLWIHKQKILMQRIWPKLWVQLQPSYEHAFFQGNTCKTT